MSSAPNHTRRRALKIGALAGVGGAAAAVYKLGPWSSPLGANADIRLGFVGLRGKGKDHLNKFRDIPGCRIVGLCDVDPQHLDEAKSKSDAEHEKATVYRNFREMVADKDIDAIVIATPNHWHSLMAHWALEAGKHIYVEKPLTHSIAEGEALVAAASASGLVVQTGTQRRSDMAYPEAKAWLAEGHLGAMKRIRVVVHRHRKRLTKRKSAIELPKALDYDLWCGPADKETLHRSKLHYDWHWNWNTGNGELGNNGIHFIDTARILLGDPGLPKRSLSIGGRLGWGKDAGQTPNSHITWFDGEIPLITEIRNLSMKPDMEAMDHVRGVREGTIVECEGGTLAWPVAYDANGKKIKKFTSDDGHGHRVNWLKAIVDGKPDEVNAPATQGHLSTTYCHLGNLSNRLGQSAAPEQLRTQLSESPVADICESMFEHLAVHNIDLTATPLNLGRSIETDGTTITGAAAADAAAIDRRAGRAPFSLKI